jgi:multiple sugar transport system permease protein
VARSEGRRCLLLCTASGRGRAARRARRRQEDRQSEIPLHLLGVRPRTVTLVTVLCVLFSFFTLIPIVYMAFSATKTQLNINDSFPFWFARPFELFQNVSLLFKNLGGDGVFARWFANTVVYASLGGGGATIISVMAGYGFARFDFRGARFGFALVIGTLLVPITAISLPLYLVYAKAHLINSIWGMVLPSMVSPIGVYLMRTFSASHVPRALLDAARIDGAGEVRIFLTIALPLLVPGIVTVLLINVVSVWNNFFLPLLIFSNQNLYPLSVGIGDRAGGGASVLLATGGLASVIPLITLFLVLQRYWKGALLLGSVTG